MQLDFFRQLASRFGSPRSSIPHVQPAPSSRDPSLELHAQDLLSALSYGALGARVQIVWNARLRSTAGTAWAARALIHLNPRLRDFGPAEIERTLRHELAHLLAHQRAGRRRIAPHGPEWEQACCDLGLMDEKRCHDLPLPRRASIPRHFYQCPHCAAKLERVRPLRRKSACRECCRKHAGGRYQERFRFVKL